jgi:phosphoglycolate phosphatase
MTLTTPKVILFDWDNTLVDTWPVIHQALNATLAFMGHEPWTLERVMQDVKHSMRDSFPALFGDKWEIASERYQLEYRAIHMEAIRALPDAEHTLKQLAATDVFVAIVSNKRGPSLRKEIEKLEWQAYFKAHVGAQDAERDKPHAAPAHMALETSPVKSGSEIWFVGDTGVDLECAKNIGAVPILYGDHVTDGKTHDGFAFAAHVRTQKELQALLAQHLTQCAA